MTSLSLVTIGNKIILNLNGEIKEFKVVGSAEVNPQAGKISYLSPIGEAVLGRRLGEKFKINLPGGKKLDCQLIKIK